MTASMDDLRPNLVGGLLGLQQGLLEDHAVSMQHAGVPQDTKFMSFQDNRLMGGLGSAHDNRLLGLAATSSAVHESRSPVVSLSAANIDKSGGSTSVVASFNHQRKCSSSTPEDFTSLVYTGLPTPGIDSTHHHTPAHTPPSRLPDHATISGECANTECY